MVERQKRVFQISTMTGEGVCVRERERKLDRQGQETANKETYEGTHRKTDY